MSTLQVYIFILALTIVPSAYGEYPQESEDAIRMAEKYIVSNGYSMARPCPDNLKQKEVLGQYDMQRPCKDYDASESHAYAVLKEELFWQVYFRKIPPEIVDGRESFRIVQIYKDIGVRLHDIELFLAPEATIIGQ